MNVEKQKWTLSRVLYLITAILLSIHALPFVGMFLNMIFIFPIVWTVLSVIILGYAKNDDRKIVGAILAIFVGILSIIGGILLYRLVDDRYLSDSMEIFIFLFHIVIWFLTVIATIFCYICTFAKSSIVVGGTVYNVQQQGYVQPKVILDTNSVVDEVQTQQTVIEPLVKVNTQQVIVNEKTSIFEEQAKINIFDEQVSPVEEVVTNSEAVVDSFDKFVNSLSTNTSNEKTPFTDISINPLQQNEISDELKVASTVHEPEEVKQTVQKKEQEDVVLTADSLFADDDDE